MKSTDCSVVSVAVPIESAVSRAYNASDLADAYAIRLPANSITDPELLARFVFSHQARWVGQLMRLRDALVARFGIKTSGQLKKSNDKRIYIFKVYETSAHEIVLGEDDKHLDFRLSVFRRTEQAADGSTTHLVLSTVVHCHNRLGRAYIMLIAPFHRMIVQSCLRRAARAGWPTTIVP
jgi:hypothetical protein